MADPVIEAASADPAVLAAIADADARAAGTADENGVAKPPVPAADEKPDWVEDKFWDAEKKTVNTEALAASYAALQAKLSGKADEPVVDPAVEPKVEGEQDIAPVAKALADAGMDFDAINAEYQADGDIKPETRAKLEAAFGKPMVDNYFAGLASQEAAASAEYAKTIHDAVGGADKYAEMLAWAGENLSPADAATYDRIATGGDAAAAALAASGLYAKFNAAGGVAPALLEGKPPASNSQGYATLQDMTNDMKDARYQRDAAFRAGVDRKIAASSGLGSR